MKNGKENRGNKFKTGILTFVLSTTMALSAFSFAACTPTTPRTPINPNPPVETPENSDSSKTDTSKPGNTDKDKEKETEEKKQQEFATAKATYNGFISGLEAERNFTYTSGNQKIEIDGKKAKITYNNEQSAEYFEKDGDTLYRYSKNENDTWQKEEEKEISIDAMLAEIFETVRAIDWEKYENGMLIKPTKISAPTTQGIDETAKLHNNSLFIQLSNGASITFNHVGETTVTLPEIEEEEEFKVEEHIEELKEGLKNYFLSAFKGSSLNNDDIYNVYLRKSSEEGLVDTIGIVLQYTPSMGGRTLYYTEITNSAVKEDITYQSICEGKLSYNARQTTYNDKFSVNISPSKQETYKEGIDILFDQLLGENARDGAAWSGWIFLNGTGTYRNDIYLLKNNTITHKRISISSSGTTLGVLDAIKQNFHGQKPGNALDTWEIVEEEENHIPECSINIWELSQKQEDQIDM